ncbi:MAG: hypothetical protein K0R49_626 [Burkholderiales bacterium]|jgi:hypothetical protein|nr:hypothetical protein [Burkholderiales bacterium]
MNKIYLKFFIILLCFTQYSWGITFEAKTDDFHNFGWHVYTITAKKLDDSTGPVTVKAINSEIKLITLANRKKTFGEPASAQIHDLNCIGKNFAHVGDFCRFKARIPCDFCNSAKEAPASMVLDIKYFFNNDAANLLVYQNPEYIIINPGGPKPISRVAFPEEKKDYPALDDEHFVLVLENGGVESLILNSVFPDRELNLVNEVESPELYGDSARCTVGGEGLKKFGDTCIMVYQFTKVSSVNSAKQTRQVNVNINQAAYKNTVTKPPVTISFKEIIPNGSEVVSPNKTDSWLVVVNVSNYYSLDPITLKSSIIDESGVLVKNVNAVSDTQSHYNYGTATCILNKTRNECDFLLLVHFIPPGKYFIKMNYSGDRIKSGVISALFEKK